MKCLKPMDLPGTVVPCGSCRFCRLQTQKTWAARILLESYFHPANSFVTLTYDDDHVPTMDGVQVLLRQDFDKFTRRLRDLTRSNKPLRYFGVGEYGSETWRPHYHFILFGHGVGIEPIVNLAWKDAARDQEKKGFTQVSELTFDRAMYTVGYTIKKMTKHDDPYLKGRPPEFAKSSNGRNGGGAIGTPALGWLADTMGKAALVDGKPGPLLRAHGDVFNTVRIEGKVLPLGRYMRRKLRDTLGISNDPRERATQLGRLDSTGEPISEVIPDDFRPTADLSDINTPWRHHAEKKAIEARQEKVNKAGEKLYRQTKLGLTTGGRI
jgi:hypothetical protein